MHHLVYFPSGINTINVFKSYFKGRSSVYKEFLKTWLILKVCSRHRLFDKCNITIVTIITKHCGKRRTQKIMPFLFIDLMLLPLD